MKQGINLVFAEKSEKEKKPRVHLGYFQGKHTKNMILQKIKRKEGGRQEKRETCLFQSCIYEIHAIDEMCTIDEIDAVFILRNTEKNPSRFILHLKNF